MGLFNRRDNAADLGRLLDREHNAILSGDFATLRRLLPEKVRLISATERSRPDGDKLQSLKLKASHNHALLEAAAQGIKSVSRDLDNHRRSFLDLETYDQSGNRSRCSNQTRSLERRV